MSETQLIRYDAMCQAIIACHSVDEVKDIRDQAMAIQIYQRQARNIDAEKKACEIRLRAERRCGQLLKEREMAKGAQGSGSNQHEVRSQLATAPETLSDLGISKTQSSRWQKLAAIPEEDFEATFAGPAKPTTTGILAAHRAASAPPPVVDVVGETPRRPVEPKALWLWGRLLDFEREGIVTADPEVLYDSMLPHMKEATLELSPVVCAWLERLFTYASEK